MGEVVLHARHLDLVSRSDAAMNKKDTWKFWDAIVPDVDAKTLVYVSHPLTSLALTVIIGVVPTSRLVLPPAV